MSFSTLLALARVVGAHADPWSTPWSLGVDSALHWSYGNFFHAVNSDGSAKWTFDAKGPIQTYSEGLNGTIHVIALPNQPAHENMTHYALDGTDGSIRWQRTSLCRCDEMCQEGGDLTQLLTSDSNLYLCCGPSMQIESINPDGSRKWAEQLPNALSVDVGPGGGVLVENNLIENGTWIKGRSVSALQPADGSVKWTWKTQHDFGGWALSNGNVFVVAYREVREGPVDTEMNLIHLSGEDGGIMWNVSYKAKGPVPTWRPGHTYWPISGCNGGVYAYIGTGRWGPTQFEFDLLAFDLDGNILRTLPCRSGCKHSTQQNDDGAEEDIFISPADFEREFDSSSRTKVVAYSGTTGHMLWNTSIAGNDYVGNLGPDGTVFAKDGSGSGGWLGMPNAMVAIRNGSEVWRAPGVTKALMAKDGTTYLQNFTHRSDGRSMTYSLSIVAEDMHGIQKWSYPISDPAIAGLDSRTSFLV